MSIKRRQEPSCRASMVVSLPMTCAVLSMRNLFVGSTRRPLAHLIDIWKLLLRFGSCGKCFDNLRNRVPAIVIEKVRRESGWTSAGATPPPRRDLRCSSNCLRQLLDCARHRESSARILGVTRERIERFFKNLASALGHCVFEDAEVLGIVIPVLVCLGIFWLIGVAVYDFVLDPHITTAASLDSLSINPDKWIPC